jgi:mono/diheme cytochrome c family protein
MRPLRYLAIFCLALALAAGIFVFIAWRPAIDPIDPPAASSFDPALVQRGAKLAAVGDCDVCHTGLAGREFAGGLALPTPFGAIYSTNITPDAETGIGNWSEAAFRRAMREGVRRDGAYLYPAFPYDHFTLVSDDDDTALYAYLMTREPVHAAAPANRLPFPLNVRLVLFGWNLLFLRQGPYRADAAQSESFNRGAYLAEGLGHCGACHTPRNLLGAENRGEKFAGAEVDGWTAYALDASSPAPVPWNADALNQYLSRGFQEWHGVARGPMAPVAENLRNVPPDDVRAIATYVAAQRGDAGPPSQAVEQQIEAQAKRGRATTPQSADSQADNMKTGDTNSGDEGALIYANTCSGCHEGPRAMPYGGIDLALSSGITGASAQNIVNVVLYGLPAAEGARSPIMPGFAASLSDRQIVVLAAYLRARFSNGAAWNDVENTVRAARTPQRAETVSNAPADETAPPATQRTNHGETEH